MSYLSELAKYIYTCTYIKIWPVWDSKEGKRENYKGSTGEGFRNVKGNRGTEEFTRPIAAVLKTKLRPDSWNTRAKRWRYGWASSKNNQRRTWGNSWEIQFRSNA